MDLSDNQLTALPAAIGQLTALKELVLGSNQLTALPTEIGQLRALRWLDLSGNPLEVPPPEVADKGIRAIRDYFRQLEDEGKDYLYEAKLLIVGEAGAGKMTLARKIQDANCPLPGEEETTRGIDVGRWDFRMEDGQTFRVNIWDFGGQEIYHATHQFFLTRRSLYVLVADARREDTDFYYWLNLVELLSDNSPLLIVNNVRGGRQRQIPERQLRGEFSNLKEVLTTDLAYNPDGLAEVVREVKHQIVRLPHVGTGLPKTWTRVRQALETLGETRPYISRDEYLDICRQNGFSRDEDMLQLSGYLHDLGVCLHYQEDPLLGKTVILKPEWATGAVYKVLDNPQVQS